MRYANGMSQGCSFSLDDISAMMTVLVRCLASKVPHAIPGCFVDDMSIVATEAPVATINLTIRQILRFDNFTMQATNATKTVAMANTEEAQFAALAKGCC